MERIYRIKICDELGLNKNTVSDRCFILREILRAVFLYRNTEVGGLNEGGSSKEVGIDEFLFFNANIIEAVLDNNVRFSELWREEHLMHDYFRYQIEQDQL